MPVLGQHFLGRVFQFTHRKTPTRLHSTCHFFLLLLSSALQPTMGFSLLSDSPPFRPFLTQLSPPSYSLRLDVFSISSTHLFLGLPLILLPVGFHSNILLGILFSSIRITCPNQAILLLFMNLTMSAFPMSSFNSWFILILLFYLHMKKCLSHGTALCSKGYNLQFTDSNTFDM